MAFKKMVSMERTPQEKAKDWAGPSLLSDNDYPSGLCICLTDAELDKLDLDPDADVGDMLHITAMGRVTSVSKTPDGCRISMTLTDIGVEDESTEDPDESDEE